MTLPTTTSLAAPTMVTEQAEHSSTPRTIICLPALIMWEVTTWWEQQEVLIMQQATTLLVQVRIRSESYLPPTHPDDTSDPL